MPVRIVACLLLALATTPALAQSKGIQIPEPGDAALFVIAVVGLILGRHASRRPPRRETDDTQA